MTTAGLTPEELDDLVEYTINHYERNRWVDLTSELQEYWAMRNMMGLNRLGSSGGMELEWKVRLANAPNARATLLYEKDDINIYSSETNAKIGWRHLETHFAYEVREEFYNRGVPAIINMVRTRRHGAFVDLAHLMEEFFWGAPANATDKAELRKPLGLLYWVVPNATEGFNGGNPSGHSDCAGIDASTVTTWRNWTGTYDAPVKGDLVKKMRKAHYKTKFSSPISYPELKGAKTQRKAIVSTYDTIAELEEALESQNDNLGPDLAPYDGKVMFRGNAMNPIPYLDENAGNGTIFEKNPVIGLDLACWNGIIQRGNLMRRTRVTPAEAHNTRVMFFDTSMNFRCVNRRRNWYLYQTGS